ncbi:MAG: Mor transcription activator family protein [Thermodesulfobacteriota bacterium]|nr:Mor transcription activator family protein [Thermodesulfobacteriota bacterium]
MIFPYISLRVQSLIDLDWSALPAGLRKLKAIVGPRAALALAATYGGGSLYVPARPGPRHRLSRLLGRKNARRLAQTYAGETLKIPKPDAVLRQIREKDILRRKKNGEPVSRLARDYNLTHRRVMQILAEHAD